MTHQKEQEQEQVLPDVWAARATAWELAAFSLRYPGQELVDALANGEWLAAAYEVLAALGLAQPEGFGECAQGEPAGLSELRADATRLFVGSPQPLANPYEGMWRAADEGVEALLFANPHTIAVERFCRACGWTRPRQVNEPLDHAACECELLELLALQVADPTAAERSLASAPAGACGSELGDAACASGACAGADGLPDFPGGSAGAAYELFRAEHVDTWMPRFADEVACQARTAAYRDIARYLKAVLS